MSANELLNLKRRTNEVCAMIAEREATLTARPQDVGCELTLSSLRDHLDDLCRQAHELERQSGRGPKGPPTLSRHRR